jgi:hypothetical protein
MATKKAKKEEKKVLNEVTLENGVKIITYEDGTVTIIPAPINLTADEAKEIFGSEEEADDEDDDEEEEEEEDTEDEDDDDDEEDDEDEDDEEDDEEEEEELTGEDLAEMDFEELEEVCDDKDLEVDPEDYEEDDIEKFRKAIAKELGLKLPAAKAKKDKKKGKK